MAQVLQYFLACRIGPGSIPARQGMVLCTCDPSIRESGDRGLGVQDLPEVKKKKREFEVNLRLCPPEFHDYILAVPTVV